jgi:inner membrane protein
MSPVTHFLTGWVLASTADLNRRDRALVTIASVIPDVDGLGAIADVLTRNSQHPLDWFGRYHHSLHNLGFALLIGLAAYVLGTQRNKVAVLAFLSFHLHLLEDLLGARGPEGYQWPIPYLMPFSKALDLTWHGQWALNAWPNFAITLTLLIVTFYLAWQRGYSPLEMFSLKADAAFVRALRRRFPRPTIAA